MSSREKKSAVIDELKERLSRCNIGILTDYRGLSTAEITVLRGKLREAGIEYRVVKNTMARFAAERADKGQLSASFEGPVAIAFGYGEITEPAKVLADYTRTAKTSLAIRGGFLGDRLLTSDEVTTLATLPPRDVMLAKAIGGLQSPMLALLNCLNSPIRGVIGVLQARIQQMEEA